MLKVKTQLKIIPSRISFIKTERLRSYSYTLCAYTPASCCFVIVIYPLKFYENTTHHTEECERRDVWSFFRFCALLVDCSITARDWRMCNKFFFEFLMCFRFAVEFFCMFHLPPSIVVMQLDTLVEVIFQSCKMWNKLLNMFKIVKGVSSSDISSVVGDVARAFFLSCAA